MKLISRSMILFAAVLFIAILGSFSVIQVFAGDRGGGTGFSISESWQIEGNTGTITVTVPVRLEGVGPGTYSLEYTTQDGTALSGSDYIATSGTLNFTDNGVQNIEITVVSDTISEPTEVFTIQFSNPVGTTLTNSSASITITNDDFNIYQASGLIGQLDGSDTPDFTAGGQGGDDRHFNWGSGFAAMTIDTVHHRMFIPDSGNNRVLIFNLDSTNSLVDFSADYVLGQDTFLSSSSGTSQTQLKAPTFAEYDSVHDRLFISDAGNNRVLVFDTTAIVNHESPVSVLGQPDFDSLSTDEISSSTLHEPAGLQYDSENNFLYVADLANHRVLVFDVATISDGEDAIYVLGQDTFATAMTSTDADSLIAPRDVSLDQAHQRLFVSDGQNDRVLVFDVSSISNGEDALQVLGQSSFSDSTAASPPTQSSLAEPAGIFYDRSSDRLFVSDLSNGRVVVYDTTEISDGEDAVGLFGQEDYDTTDASSITLNGTLFNPSDAFYDSQNKRLYVIDPKYNRIQIFNFIRITTESFSDGEEGSAYSETASVEGSQGEVSFNVSSGTLPTGLALSSSGELTGEPSEAGEFTFTITATDPNESIIGASYSDSQEYTITITSPADEESPEISSIVATPDSTTARISWTTNENASSTVFFGLTTEYEMDHVGSDDLVTSHTVDISGLSACTTYHFMVASGDESRNNAFSEDATFRTTNCPSGGGGSVVPIVLQSFNQPGSFQVFLPPTSESQTMRELLFKRNLYFGLVDSDVQTLQHFLNTHGFPLAKTGPGSIGYETDYFGQRTKQALILFQRRHMIQPAIGFLGPVTRNFIGDGN